MICTQTNCTNQMKEDKPRDLVQKYSTSLGSKFKFDYVAIDIDEPVVNHGPMNCSREVCHDKWKFMTLRSLRHCGAANIPGFKPKTTYRYTHCNATDCHTMFFYCVSISGHYRCKLCNTAYCPFCCETQLSTTEGKLNGLCMFCYVKRIG